MLTINQRSWGFIPGGSAALLKSGCIRQALSGCSVEVLCPAPGQEMTFGSARAVGGFVLFG